MSTKKGRDHCPKCHRHMRVRSRREWYSAITGEWRVVCLQCVRDHDSDPLLHLRANKRANMRPVGSYASFAPRWGDPS